MVLLQYRERSKIAGGQTVTWYSHVDCSTKCTYFIVYPSYLSQVNEMILSVRNVKYGFLEYKTFLGSWLLTLFLDESRFPVITVSSPDVTKLETETTLFWCNPCLLPVLSSLWRIHPRLVSISFLLIP
jgi:hypothetical protein